MTEYDPLRRATLLQGCRQARRDRGTFKWWLNQHRDDITELLCAARAEDQDLLAELRADTVVRKTLSEVTPDYWQQGDPRALDALTDWALCGARPVLTFRFSQIVDQLIQNGECYREFADRLRPVFAEPGNPGWPYLLCNAAEASLKERELAAAVELVNEAWHARHELPKATAETAKSLAHLATVHCSAIGHLPSDLPADEILGSVLERITVARKAAADAIAEPFELAKTVVELGISESQIWYSLKRHGKVGILAAEQHRADILQRTEHDMWQILAPGTTYSSLPPRLRLAVTRLLGDLACAAKFVGETRLAVRAARDAQLLCQEPHQRLNSLVTAARVGKTIDDRLRQNEELLREIHAGALTGLSEWQRGRLEQRLRDEKKDLARELRHAKKPTAVWFWRRQIDLWLAQIRGFSAEAPAAGDNGRAPKPWLANVMDCLHRENLPGLVICLMRAANGTGEALSTVVEGLVAADNWRPPKRHTVTGRLEPGKCRSQDDVELAALQLAAEFTESYVEYYAPQVRMRLANITTLSWDERERWASEAFRAAVGTKRRVYALQAKEWLLDLAIRRSDSPVVKECVNEILWIVRDWVVSATGTADLIDVAKELTSRANRTAARLAWAGYPELAFDVARSAVGVISRMIAGNPRLAVEFELVENRAKDSGDRLFELMRDRILGNVGVSLPREHTVAEIAARYRTKVSFVQLLSVPAEGCWVLGWTRSGNRQKYWAVPLDLDADGLKELSDVVWNHLKYLKSTPDGALDVLHRDVVRFVEPHVVGSEDIVFVPHDNFGGLPLHAAHGPDGFLIQRHCVSYLPNLDGRDFPSALKAEALVAGWDPEIGAGIEAAELTSALNEQGLSVTRPRKAVIGRRMLLDSDGNWGLVHIAAHGHFIAWPESMGSWLALSKNIRVTAGDWLRSGCQAQFVFINACTVGRHSPHAGDLNGFPLAIRARGSVADVSALAPVPIDSARAFAKSFYPRWQGRDSLVAYQFACLEAIRRGEIASGWAPYVHSGPPVELPAQENP